MVLWHRDPSIEALKVALQLPLSNYLPASDSIWAGSMPEWATRVTLHQLLTHTSGIASYTALTSFESVVGKPISVVELTSMFKNEPLNFEPGEKFHYCNSGYFLLSEVVARLAGKTLSQYLTEAFFTPLGMHKTFMPEVGSGRTMKESGDYPNLARGYNCGIEPNSPMVEIEKYFDSTFSNGAGAIVSTVGDLVIWNYSLHNNMALPKEVTELMLTEHVLMDPENQTAYYCYGIMKTKYSNGDVFTHIGRVAGFFTTIAYRPHDQLSFVAFTNIRVGTTVINAAFDEEYKRLSHIENETDLNAAVDQAMEERFPGFLAIKKSHELMKLKDIVTLDTK